MTKSVPTSDKLDTLEKNLGITFKDKTLLRQALLHRSFLNENKTEKESNERLEFLGDSVLSVIVSTKLFLDYKDFPEGKLTNLRSALVRTNTLSVAAEKIKLGNFLLMSRGEENSGGKANKSLLADTFEAVIGAIYLDQGIESAKKFLEKHLLPMIDTIQTDQSVIDYKSLLQEQTQEKSKQSPVYSVASETGPDHDKTFTIEVKIGEKTLGTGTGKSKQEAEQNAARVALKEELS